MKKSLLCLVLVLAMALVFVPAVSAAGDLYLTVGEHAQEQLLRIPGEAAYTADQVPPGMEIREDPGAGSVGLWLSGTPTVAGSWHFTLSSSDGQNYECMVYVQNSDVPPYITYYSHDVSCAVGDNATLTVSVENPSGWALRYVWFRNGYEIPGSDTPNLSLDTSAVAGNVYHCTIYASRDGRSVQLDTADIRTEVQQGTPVITAVAVRSLPDRVEYTVGEYLDVKGLGLNVYYSDGHVEFVREAAIECIPYYFTQPGLTTVSARYGSCSTSFTVNVKEPKTVTGISVNTMPAKLNYNPGETLDVTGLTVRADYSDQTYVIADPGMGVSAEPKTLNTAGEQKITVTYEGKTCEFKVTVADPDKVTGISFRSLPSKTAYVVGEEPDLTGLMLDVQSEGSSWPVSGNDSRVSVSPARLEKEGSQKIVVTYRDGSEEFKQEFSVFVAAKAEHDPADEEAPEAKEENAPAEAESAGETAPAQKKGIVSNVLLFAGALLAGLAIGRFLLQKKK